MKKNINDNNLNPIKESLIIAMIYGIIGSLWVSFTDHILSQWIKDYYEYQHLQTIKGWFYVLITMILLYLLVYKRLIQYKKSLITLDDSLKAISKMEKELKVNIQKLEDNQKKLSISNQRYELAVDGVNDAIWDWDIVNDIYYLSPKWERKIMGECDDHTFTHWLDYIHPDDKERYVNFIDNFLSRKHEQFHYLFRIICFDKSLLWIYSNGKVIYNDDKKALRIAGSHTDISNQVKLKQEYKKNTFLIEKIINNASNFIVIWDHEGNIRKINPYVTKILGYENEEIIDDDYFGCFAPEITKEEKESIVYQIKTDHVHYSNSHIKSKSNQDVYILWTSNILYQYNANKYDFISVGTDITNLKIIKDELNYLSFYDELTDLPNRNFFEKHVGEMIDKKKHFALLYLDIDNFKYINDTLGHGAGDQLLKDMSVLLNDKFKTPHFVSRLSGDEFLIVLYKNNKMEQIIKYLNYITKENSKPWIYHEQEYFITVTVGISLYPEHGKDVQTLLKNADFAMHSAKESGKNNFHVFDSKMLDKNAVFIRTLNELKKAINNDELVVRYQPFINLNTGDIIGVEALVRWQHPARGLIQPVDFIEIAEKTGFIDSIDQVVFEKACKQKREWDKLGYQDMILSINVSNKRFKDKDVYQEMFDIVDKYKIKPGTIQIEITESVIMENIDQGIEILDKLRNLGIKIALDDFGKGFSSLNYLMELPIDHVKLDKIFIDNITQKDDYKLIIQSIIQLTHALKKQVTVEGIELLEQLNLVKQYRCDIGQGYYFEKPVEHQVIEEMYRKKTILEA